MANILIFAADPALLSLMTLLLNRAGHDTEKVHGRETAEERLRAVEFDLVIADRQMPGDAGTVLLRYVVRYYPDTATMLMTTADDPHIALTVTQGGITDYLSKPIQKNSVLARVANALRRRELEIANRRYREHLETLVSERTESLERAYRHLESTQIALRERERDYRRLVENANSVILRIATDGTIRFANPYALKFFGFSHEELIGRHVTETLLPSEDLLGMEPRALWNAVAADPAAYAVNENRNIRRDGSLVWVAWTNKGIHDDEGRLTEILSIGNDVTDRKIATEKLLLMATVVEQMMESVFITDTAGRIEYVNPAFERITGYTAAEAVGRTPRILKSGHHDEAYYRRMWGTISSGNVWREMFVNRRKDGTLYHAVGTILPVKNAAGAIRNYVSVKRDITQEMVMEAQLRQAQKLESIGQLAAGIAHEINTPMQYVGDNVRFLQESFERLRPMLEYLSTEEGGKTASPALEGLARESRIEFLLREITPAFRETLEGIASVTHIVGAMKKFSHPGGEKTLGDINVHIRNTVTVTRNEWKYVADMDLDLDENLPPVPCHAGEFNQALLNLIINAAHAIEERLGGRSPVRKGRITIRSRREENRVVIQVEDTGTGIPEAIRHKVFDPFFTTKGVGRGTGQGLSIAWSAIVEKHGGTIGFDTREGEGTTFLIRMPLTPEPKSVRRDGGSAFPAESEFVR